MRLTLPSSPLAFVAPALLASLSQLQRAHGVFFFTERGATRLPPPGTLSSVSHLPRSRAVFFSRGGGAAGVPPSERLRSYGGDVEGDDNYKDQPPIGEVIGAGAVGAVAGQVVFQSLLISIGLGVTAMSVAASSADMPGEIARSSGRMAVAVFDRVTQLNGRYELTDRFVDGAKMAGWRLRKFDQEHAVVHRATQGTKKALLDAQEFNEAHALTARAGETISTGLDKVTEVLAPPPSGTSTGERSSSSRSSEGGSSSSGGDSRQKRNGEIGGTKSSKKSNSGGGGRKTSSRSSSKKRVDRKSRVGQQTRRGGIGGRAGKGRRGLTGGRGMLQGLSRDEATRRLAEFREKGRRWIDEHDVLDM